jgi:thioredoxin 1
MEFLNFTEENWESEVLESEIPVLVDFRLPGTGSHVIEDLLLDEIQTQWSHRIKIGTLDAEEYPEMAPNYHISDFSTLTLFYGGEIQFAAWGSGRVRRMVAFWLKPLLKLFSDVQN